MNYEPTVIDRREIILNLEFGLRSWLFPKGGSSFDQREKKQLVGFDDYSIMSYSMKNSMTNDKKARFAWKFNRIRIRIKQNNDKMEYNIEHGLHGLNGLLCASLNHKNKENGSECR